VRGDVIWCHSDGTRHRELLNATGMYCQLGSRNYVREIL